MWKSTPRQEENIIFIEVLDFEIYYLGYAYRCKIYQPIYEMYLTIKMKRLLQFTLNEITHVIFKNKLIYFKVNII